MLSKRAHVAFHHTVSPKEETQFLYIGKKKKKKVSSDSRFFFFIPIIIGIDGIALRLTKVIYEFTLCLIPSTQYTVLLKSVTAKLFSLSLFANPFKVAHHCHKNPKKCTFRHHNVHSMKIIFNYYTCVRTRNIKKNFLTTHHAKRLIHYVREAKMLFFYCFFWGHEHLTKINRLLTTRI